MDWDSICSDLAKLPFLVIEPNLAGDRRCGAAIRRRAKDVILLEEQLHYTVSTVMHNNIQALIVKAYLSAFTGALPLSLSRFTSLQKVLQSEVLPGFVTQCSKAASVDLDQMIKDFVRSTMADIAGNSIGSAAFITLKWAMRGCVIKHVIQQMELQPLSLPDSFELTENEAVAARRAELQEKAQKLQKAMQKIRKIGGNTLSPSAVSQSLAAPTSLAPASVPVPSASSSLNNSGLTYVVQPGVEDPVVAWARKVGRQ